MSKLLYYIFILFLGFLISPNLYASVNLSKPSSGWDIVKKNLPNIAKTGKKLTPAEIIKKIGKEAIDEGWDALNDPENTDPHRNKNKDGDDDDNDSCDGTWMYHAKQGGIETESGSYVEHAKTVFYDYAVSLSKNNAPSKPFLDPNFRTQGDVYTNSSGNQEQIVVYTHYDFWGSESASLVQVYKYCDKSKPKKKKDDDDKDDDNKEKDKDDDSSDDDKDKKKKDDDDSSDDDSDKDKKKKDDDDDGKDGKDGKDGDDGDKGKKGDDGDDGKNGKDGKDGKDGDDDDGKDGKDGKDGDDDDDGSKQEKPHCNYSEFHKKVCDWIDWTQKDDLDKDDGKVEVKDLGKDLELDDDKVQFGQSCPSGQTFTFVVAGATVSETISYNDLCTGFIKLRPFVIAIGYIISAMIIGGRRV